jgi:DNA-directed RNA polymerase specialized sigma24 family protein
MRGSDMAIDMEKFKSIYGKIKYLETITARHPVKSICSNDINRKLMIKFKYGDLTLSEEHEFHEAIKKMIYKVMHKNCVMMDWEDVYQEIWKKIVKSKHTWKEWKGTMVSTWITIVANSVINTLHQSVNRYNSRFCLYDDLVSSSEPQDNNNGNSQDTEDVIVFRTDEESMSDSELKKTIWNEQFEEFRAKLDKAESFVFDIIVSMSGDILDAYDKNLKIPYRELREKSGYDEATFAMVIYNIKKKYSETFNIKMDDFQIPIDDDSETEFLF